MAMERMFVTKFRGFFQECYDVAFEFADKVTYTFYQDKEGWSYFGMITSASIYELWKQYILDNRMIDPDDIEFDVFYTYGPLDN